MINKKRAENGLSALTMDSSLLETAMIRAGEQEVLFSHTRPDGAGCFSANAAMIAENVAINQRSASEVMNSWMNSEGHRENILSKDATTIGIGCFYMDGVYTWAQCFGNAEKSAGSSKTGESDGKSSDVYSKRHFFGSDHKPGGSYGIRRKSIHISLVLGLIVQNVRLEKRHRQNCG